MKSDEQKAVKRLRSSGMKQATHRLASCSKRFLSGWRRCQTLRMDRKGKPYWVDTPNVVLGESSA